MVIDAFNFNNELDTLEIRFNILNPVVDKFVIVEATKTFSGRAKPIYYLENKHRFREWNDKVVHYIVGDLTDEDWEFAKKSPCVGNGEHYWVREFCQKEKLKEALKFCNDDDTIFISDVDEIWNPKLIYTPIGSEVLKPKQLPYMYYINQRTDEDWLGWSGTICTRYENIKNGVVNHLRTDELTPYRIVEAGGWHFNSLGGREKKQEAFSHPIYENEVEWKRREINMRKDESDLPDYLITNKQKWKEKKLWRA